MSVSEGVFVWVHGAVDGVTIGVGRARDWRVGGAVVAVAVAVCEKLPSISALYIFRFTHE